MNQDNKEKSSRQQAIGIDFDHLDVARIMEEVKRKAGKESQRGSKSVFQKSSGSFDRVPDEAETMSTEGPPGLRQKTRRLLLKIMSPFSPLIKLLILPVYEEHRQTVMILDHANKRIDQLTRFPEKEQEYIKLLHNLCHNLVVELTKLKIEVDLLKTKVQIMDKDFEFLAQRERSLEKEAFK
jgi:hypothetical protein